MPREVFQPDVIRWRLEKGQLFNAYESAKLDGFIVGIGPVTDFLGITTCERAEIADYLVDMLRAAVDQPKCLTPLEPDSAA